MMLNKLMLALLAYVSPLMLFGQTNTPIVHTNIKDVQFIHDDFIMNWHLDSSKKPDIYTIANNLKTHKINIITDVDSTTFTVDQGMRFNFVMQYQKLENYTTQIYVLPNPVFFNPTIYVPFLLLLLGLVGVLVFKKIKVATVFLLKFGTISGIGFWAMTLIGGFLHGNYNHAKMGVSELGSIGNRSELFTAITTMLLAVFSFSFSIGFVKASKQLRLNLVPSILSFAMAISMAWAAVFPSGNIYHGVLGPLPIAILIGALVAAVFWKKDRRYHSIRVLSLICFVLMMLFVLRFIPYLQQHYEGFIQRTLWLGWSVWYIGLSHYLPKILGRNKSF